MKSGNIARMWFEKIEGNVPFCEQYPGLFGICRYPNCTVRRGLEVEPDTFFRRNLFVDLRAQWNAMRNYWRRKFSSRETDGVSWGMGGKNKLFTKFVYELLETDLHGCDYRWICIAGIPLKLFSFGNCNRMLFLLVM